MAKDKKLTDKQEMFCMEYIKDMNATAAYIRAGYKVKNEDVARKLAPRLMANDVIATRINELQSERAKEIKLDANWVLQRFKDISDRCMQIEPVCDKEGNPIGEFKFDAAGANKSTEMIGKHLGMFTDKLDINANVNVKKLEDFF